MLKKTRNIAAAGALALAGAGGGAALAIGGAADAATGSYSSYGSADGGHSDETTLTGATADKVNAAALAKYPDATVELLETDSDGVYEAHITTKAGDHITVQVGKDFTVTGTRTGRAGHDD